MLALAVVLLAQDVVRDDFEKDAAAWAFSGGAWERRDGALVQGAAADPWAVALLKDRTWADVDVSVKVKPVSGREDQAGGVVFRAKDASTYYLVRLNALEDNVRLYTMTDGRRVQIASAKVEAPKAGAWHALRVTAQGPRIRAWLDGALLLDHQDGTFREGRVGLWTKADSVTAFDDVEIKPAAP